MYTKNGHPNIGGSYHQHTKDYRPQEHRSKLVGGGGVSRVNKKDLSAAISLPKPQTGNGPALWEAITRRRSCRHYSQKALSQAQLSQLVWAAQGIVKRTGHINFSTSPISGGIFDLDIFTIVFPSL
jgi:hypothetical protein